MRYVALLFNRPLSPTSRALLRFGQLTLLYILLVFLLPGNHQVMRDHNLTAFEYRVLVVCINLPSFFVWAVAFYGYAKLFEYAESIQRTGGSEGFRRLAFGCAWLAWSLPVRALTSLVLNAIANSHPGFSSASIIIINYVALLVSLIGFIVIGSASRELFEKAKISLSSTSMRSIMAFFVTGGVLYCYLIFRQFNSTSLGAIDNPYHLPIWLMVLTIIIPYLYAWFVGIVAIYEMVVYSRQVQGVLYRQALQLLVGGLIAVIIGSIALQYATSIRPPAGHLLISSHLVLNLIFRIISGVGFVLIALGTMRLKKIEEV